MKKSEEVSQYELYKQINAEEDLKVLWNLVYAYRWRPIEEFHTFQPLFCVLSNGTPDTAEYFKYKGTIPEWAKYFYILPPLEP